MNGFEMPRALAASFAFAVTEETKLGYGLIAKNGEASLFRTLQHLIPQASTEFEIEFIRFEHGNSVHG